MRKSGLIFVSILALLFGSCRKNNRMTVGSVIFDENGEWFTEAIYGIRAGARDKGVYLVETNSHYDVNLEKDLVQDHIKNRASAIIICPIDYGASGKIVSDVQKMNVPVVTWNTIVYPPPSAQVIVDSKKLGSATGEYLVKYFEANKINDLKTALVTNDLYSVAIDRRAGFLESVKPLLDDGTLEIACEIKAELREESKVAIRKMISENPGIGLIWCWNQTTLLAAIDVLKQMARTDILIAGVDMSMSIAREMLGNEVKILAVTTQQPYQMGYDAVSCAVDAALGKKIEPVVVVPVITYTKDDQKALLEYIKSHSKFEK